MQAASFSKKLLNFYFATKQNVPEIVFFTLILASAIFNVTTEVFV
jgi:hypothetical protein